MSSLQRRQFQHHNNDTNNTSANTTLFVDVSSINGKEEIKKALKLVSCSDSEDLAKKNMEYMVISDNSSKDIMKNYLEVSLHAMVKVLEIMDEFKFEAKECGKKL